MAARKNLRVDQKSRDKIRATQLVKRLQSHALGELELTQTQIKAAEILLKKCLPDLKQSEISAAISGSMDISSTFAVTFVDADKAT